ncbi:MULTISPECIES: DUF2971 domain-containing protein [unclassified Pseudomonas]|uniref:DUF2971 domain-containing protein n=1 Tax=unclassified Pseudomonas TaxID=196821 RepID=UPI001CBBE398|nr:MULTISPECIES: DUF2971 domain-containing protein [unclassified Pseudomonas]
MRLFKYVDMAGLQRVLTGGVRFTQPGAFNDPFELLPEIFVPNGTAEQPISISFDLIGPRRPSDLASLSYDFEDDYCNDVQSRDIVRSLNENVGIFCLSKNNDSLLMWSHYAEQYAGAVVEFETDHKFFEGLIEVEYASARPKKDISYYLSAGGHIPIAELCVKSDAWAYESEYRIARSLKACERAGENKGFGVYIQKVPMECIKSVCLGERSDLLEQRKIWELLKDTSIAMSIAAISNNGFGFRWEYVKYDSPVGNGSPIFTPRTAHIFKNDVGQWGDVARWTIEHHKLSKIAQMLA